MSRLGLFAAATLGLATLAAPAASAAPSPANGSAVLPVQAISATETARGLSATPVKFQRRSRGFHGRRSFHSRRGFHRGRGFHSRRSFNRRGFSRRGFNRRGFSSFHDPRFGGKRFDKRFAPHGSFQRRGTVRHVPRNRTFRGGF